MAIPSTDIFPLAQRSPVEPTPSGILLYPAMALTRRRYHFVNAMPFTNLPAALTEMVTADGPRLVLVDLDTVSQLTFRAYRQTAGNAGAVALVGVSTDGGSTFPDMLCSLSLNGTAAISVTEVIPERLRVVDVLLSVFTQGGDGASDPQAGFAVDVE